MLIINQIEKRYQGNTAVLTGLNFKVEQGECVAVVGESGCGKSTLLNIIGTLDQPDAGRVLIDGVDLAALNEKELAAFRNERIGFVFQLHHLLPQCSVLENVLVPSLLRPDSAETRAMQLLNRVGLSHRLDHRPGQLSGGERQRVAVVRALINEPSLLLADEPTGALNERGADELMELLLDLNREENLALIMVTHSMRLAGRLDRVVEMIDGKLK
ncbi:ABC transporter ATP-binding protein [Pontiellaceae bacterium B1224]|nr:ABC transporter ATP-binding protein [Pontiellaceae bacterium B1224]